MQGTYRIYIPLAAEEMDALRSSAQSHYRHPRDQARYLLRKMLLGEPPAEATSTNSKSAGVRQDMAGALASEQSR
jgi:hypothetical protein